MTRSLLPLLVLSLASFSPERASADTQTADATANTNPIEEVIVESIKRSGAVVRPDTIWAVYYDQRLGTRLYRQGNYEEAFHYLLTAARHGLKYAQAQLSYLYLTGVGGVEQDNEAAVGWLGVAATGKTMPEIRDYYKDLLAQVPEPLRDDADAVVTCRRRGPQLFCTFDDEITGDDPSSGRGAGPFENVSYGRYPLRQSGRPLSRNFNLPAAQYESLFEPKEPTYQ
jgi:hypothetical protein